MATLTKRVQTDIGWDTITTEAQNGRLTQFLLRRSFKCSIKRWNCK